MITLFDEHPMGRKPVNGQDMKWGIYLAQVAPWRCELNGPDKKGLMERDAARRRGWARAMLHLIFPVKGASGFDPHPKEEQAVVVFDMNWLVLLAQACRLPPLEFHRPESPRDGSREQMEMFLADAWERVEWAKAMLHMFFPVQPPITPVPLEPLGGEGCCK